MACYVFITGGVVSSLGKGLLSASLGLLLRSRGYKVTLKKLDPYLNVDPGTMNPYEHGEVYVTEDGGETDLDLGHYERFVGIKTSKGDNITSGKIYRKILSNERHGFYLGKTIQVVPHFTDLVKGFLGDATESNPDFVLIEVGGTVGDIEGLPFLEAIRQFKQNMDSVHGAVFLHLTLVPYLKSSGESKTKPTQYSVRTLCSSGITPDLLVCRSEASLGAGTLAKISEYCNVKREDVIPAVDVADPHLAPLELRKVGLDERVLFHAKVEAGKDEEGVKYFKSWERAVQRMQSLEDSVKVSIIGKYSDNKDSYKSILESLKHGGLHANKKVKVEWIDAEMLERSDASALKMLEGSQGVLIPGGFGQRGVKGKVIAAKHARLGGVPFLGICFGMQIALIEFARNVMKMENADSAEFGKEGIVPVIEMMMNFQNREGEMKKVNPKDMVETMRLGSYRGRAAAGSKVRDAYGKEIFEERHRHRYEVNPEYLEMFQEHGVVFCFSDENSSIVEAFELKRHPWYVGVQFHPEFCSNILSPHPLFFAFIDSIVAGSVSG